MLEHPLVEEPHAHPALCGEFIASRGRALDTSISVRPSSVCDQGKAVPGAHASSRSRFDLRLLTQSRQTRDTQQNTRHADNAGTHNYQNTTAREDKTHSAYSPFTKSAFFLLHTAVTCPAPRAFAIWTPTCPVPPLAPITRTRSPWAIPYFVNTCEGCAHVCVCVCVCVCVYVYVYVCMCVRVRY